MERSAVGASRLEGNIGGTEAPVRVAAVKSRAACEGLLRPMAKKGHCELWADRLLLTCFLTIASYSSTSCRTETRWSLYLTHRGPLRFMRFDRLAVRVTGCASGTSRCSHPSNTGIYQSQTKDHITGQTNLFPS